MPDTAATCPNCGNAKDPSAAYCVHCGARATTAPATPTASAGAQTTGGATSSPPPPPTPPPAQSVTPASLSPAPASGEETFYPLTQRGFLQSLFDLSFTSLVTTKIIKVLYVLAMIVIGLTALLFIVAAFHRSGADGIVVLFIVAPIVSFFYLVYARVLLELIIALFRIMENTGELVAQGRRAS